MAPTAQSKRNGFKNMPLTIGAVITLATLVGMTFAVVSWVDRTTAQFVGQHEVKTCSKAHPCLDERYATKIELERSITKVGKQLNHTDRKIDKLITEQRSVLHRLDRMHRSRRRDRTP